jgi:hypothetical protein
MNDDIESTIAHIQHEKDFFQKAQLIDSLKKNKGISTKELAQKLQMPASQLCHILRLLKLPDIVIDGYYSKVVSITHLFILARLKNHDQMMKAYEKVLANTLSSPKTEELVRELLYGISSPVERISREDIEMFTDLLEELDPNLEVKLVQTRVKGKLVFEIKADTKTSTEVLLKILQKLIPEKSVIRKKKETVTVLD